MDLRFQPKPEIEIKPADKGIVSRKEYFAKKKIEEINQYFFPGHLIRNWKPKAELIYPSVPDENIIQYELDFNRDVQSCFVEDYAEEVYLRSPPPCFVIFGKFGTHLVKLSQNIAEEYGSVLIQVDDIVNQVLKTKSETSKLLDKILRLGVSLTLNFILALLSFVAHTPEARHRGYVLCGLPSLPLSYDLSIEDQFKYLFTWDNKPTVFINVLFEDEDLVKTRSNLRYELENVGNEKCFVLHSLHNERSEDEEEEETEDELLPIKNKTQPMEPDINISPSRPWAQLPRDSEFQLWSELELYDIYIKPFIDIISARVDPQYFITVDSRVKNEFELIQARMSLLKLWKSPLPVSFIPLKEKQLTDRKDLEDKEAEEEGSIQENEEDIELRSIVSESPQTAFLKIFFKNTISPKYRWELSHYNYICPVSLREGEIVEGKSEFSVIFLKYIYFLRNEEAMRKFLINPRPYALPIRPKPLTRFIIIGYPYSGKTSLAKHLSQEFSIPLIDLKTILNNDLNRKKTIYQEFCQQKAECREMIRLTSYAWQDWRIEEEQRIDLIEEWIQYIQSLLMQRIEQFYSLKTDSASTIKETQVNLYSFEGSEASLIGPEGDDSVTHSHKSKNEEEAFKVRGVPIRIRQSEIYNREFVPPDDQPTPSERIIKAMKNKDYDFHKNGLEVEANLFFSSLWNKFSQKKDEKFSVSDKEEDRSLLGEGEEAYYVPRKSSESDIIVDWVSLLPPQSLSSLLLNKKPYSVRERRKSFRIFLAAASKAYWAPSPLKTEFAKWRLPCFMDIPLCEIFLDNPLLLLKYCPEWLKERPLIPDPVDSNHPAILEAGRKAYNRANIVTIKQSKEEVGILLRDAIEKSEKEGMRISGEVISPGGWVVDNMVLDQEVWAVLVREKVYADHIYFMIDEEPECRRIINTWNDLHPQSFSTQYSSKITLDTEQKEKKVSNFNKKREYEHSALFDGMSSFVNIVANLLIESSNVVAEGDKELDKIYNILADSINRKKHYVPPFSVDPFSHDILHNSIDTWRDLKEDSLNEEATLVVQSFMESSSDFFSCRRVSISIGNLPIGAELQTITSKIVNIFNPPSKNDEKKILPQSTEEELNFFISLILLPHKLETIKEWLNSINKGDTITEIIVTNKKPKDIHIEVVNTLNLPFIKKPRELESFEVEEIKKEIELDEASENVENEEDEDEEKENNKNKKEEKDDREDVRIYGESGSFCIVNLERNILLRGNPDFSLRYYGKLYFFWDQEYKNKFIENPEKYAPYYSVIRSLPPVRLFVIGPIGCSKSFFGSTISNQINTPSVNYIKHLNRKLLPYLMPGYQKFTALTDRKLLLSDSHSKEARELKEKFMNAPFEKRQYWLENNPYISDLYEDQKKVHEGLTALNLPFIPTSFPELTYNTVDKWPVTSDEESDETQTNSPNEIPFMSMKNIEEKVQKYIKSDGDLGDLLMENSLGILYSTLPFIRQGYVLNDFPMRLPDVKYIIGNKWIPDLIIEITLPEQDVLDRNIDKQMEEWTNRLRQEENEEQLLEDTLNSIQRTFRIVRRMELLKEKRAAAYKNIEGVAPTEMSFKAIPKSQERVTQKKSSGRIPTQGILGAPTGSGRNINKDYFELPAEIDLEIEEEVEKIINEEFPPLIFNPIFESYESGKERIIADITENYQRDVKEIIDIKEALKDYNIPWIEIDGTGNAKKIQNEIFIRLNELKKRIGQRGEFAFTLKMSTAEKLLQQGYYFLSKFGKWCPVQVYRMKNPIHMFRPLKARGKIIPIAYRNYIYFVGGEKEKTNFLNDPVKYVLNEPHHPNIPLRIAVIGPPKSGKSVLSLRLGYMFDLKIITMGSAIRFVLEKMPGTSLQKSIDSYLKRGCFLPLSLKIEAILASLNDPQCVTQGFVFDGIPFDAAMTQSLAEEGKLPFVILSLVQEPYWGKIKRENLDLKTFRLPYKQRVNLDTRYKEWTETYTRFAQWNLNTYNNLYEMNAKSSVTDIFYWAYDIIKKSFFAILYYVEYCVTDRVLPLQYLCVSQNEYELRKSEFHNNCPVCWGELGKLRSTSDPPPRLGLVQYLNNFYWICPEHFEKFLKHPKMYFPPHAETCPSDLPKVISKGMLDVASKEIVTHGFGRCPVTRIDFPSSLDWEGSWSYGVLYCNKIYLCRNQEMLDRFLARPWRYCAADTAFEYQRTAKSKAIEELIPPVITSLPPVGFLEQTVANLIHDSLQIIGSVRPLYPKLTPTCTGCIFIGLYLKVNNPKKRHMFRLEIECLDYMTFFCKAYRYTVTPYRGRAEEGQGDIEFDKYENSNSESSTGEEMSRGSGLMEAERPSEDSGWLDFETQADKKMWSAKYLNQEFVTMKLTKDEELLEVSGVPKMNVILRYQTYSLRVKPIPPVANCLTFIYTRKPDLKLPEKFNYNTLYQPLPVFSSPYPQSMLYNPGKEFSVQLHLESKLEEKSTSNLWKDKRAISDIPSEDLKADPLVNMNYGMQYLIDRFIPRFQLLDILTSVNPPNVPKVIEIKPVFFNPHRDYTYTLLMSEFFQMSHVLKCYEWGESQHYLEHTNILDKNLGLCNVPSRLIPIPKKTSSAISRKSIDSYMEAFETANSFFVHKDNDGSRRDSLNSMIDKSSLVNYIQVIILEKLDEIITRVSATGLSYDSFEVNIVASENEVNKPVTVFREILPYPPLNWDIITHPYFAYRAIPSIFEAPHLDEIAHERHFSLLDGIIEPNDNFRFVRYPSWVHKKRESPDDNFQPSTTTTITLNKCKKTSPSTSSLKKRYFVYDFFNIGWTAFLPYPYYWAYNLDIADNVRNVLEDEASNTS